MGLSPHALRAPEFPMLLLIIVPLVGLAIWGIPAGARVFHGEIAKPIGWMSAEWLAEHRASLAP